MFRPKLLDIFTKFVGFFSMCSLWFNIHERNSTYMVKIIIIIIIMNIKYHNYENKFWLKYS